jgi:hypothetical protein
MEAPTSLSADADPTAAAGGGLRRQCDLIYFRTIERSEEPLHVHVRLQARASSTHPRGFGQPQRPPLALQPAP